jgi:hypothetical protein
MSLTDGTAPHYPEAHVKKLVDLGLSYKDLAETDVDQYVDMYVTEK